MLSIRAFFDSPEGLALWGVLGVMAADLLLGVSAAIRDGTFQLAALAAFLRKHAAGRVLPIGILLMLGYFGQMPALTAIGAMSAAAYTLETIGSIRESWGSGRDIQQVPKA